MPRPIKITIKRTVLVEVTITEAQSIAAAKRWVAIQDIHDLAVHEGDIVEDGAKVAKVEFA